MAENKKIKVLLVEDDPMVVKMYKRKLTMDGFDLSLAFNGEEGLKAVESNRPDIVLLDIMMPKMNGFETLKRLKADKKTKDIPVVILTNLGDRSQDVEKSKGLGAIDHWVKANTPLTEITKRINIIINKKS